MKTAADFGGEGVRAMKKNGIALVSLVLNLVLVALVL